MKTLNENTYTVEFFCVIEFFTRRKKETVKALTIAKALRDLKDRYKGFKFIKYVRIEDSSVKELKLFQ